jgi:uncharacterized membrane protein
MVQIDKLNKNKESKAPGHLPIKASGKEINVVMESPWKKIIIVGILIVAFVVATEFVGKGLSKIGSGLKNIHLSPESESGAFYTLSNPYLIYPILIAIILVIGIVIFILLRRHKKAKIQNVKTTKDIGDNDVKRVLKRVDELLEKLPQEEIDRFAGTKDAKLYKALLKKYGV